MFNNSGDTLGVAVGSIFVLAHEAIQQDVIKDGGDKVVAEAGAFMHELGHTLGLDHGGLLFPGVPDGTNLKPNHLSVMNYAFATTGLIKDGSNGLLDYSRFSSLFIPLLDENGGLDEKKGLRGTTPISPYGTKWYCRKTDKEGREAKSGANGPIDWDCDGLPDDAPVKANINADTIDECPSGPDKMSPLLTSINEWKHLSFNTGDIGQLAQNIPPDVETSFSGETDLPADRVGGKNIYPYDMAQTQHCCHEGQSSNN